MNKERYVSREISWLSFNARVLQEAADKSVPLIERIKFLGILETIWMNFLEFALVH